MLSALPLRDSVTMDNFITNFKYLIRTIASNDYIQLLNIPLTNINPIRRRIFNFIPVSIIGNFTIINRIQEYFARL